MADIATVADDAATAQIEQYYNDADELARQALDGEIDEDEYLAAMNDITTAVLLIMFLSAGAVLNGPGQAELDRQLAQSRSSIAVLTDDIYSGRYSARAEASPGFPVQTSAEGLVKLQNRLSLYTTTAARVHSIGQVNTRKEINFRWQVGPTEHCGDCIALNGVILSADEWKQLGIAPQSPDLECGGYRCQCGLVPTAAPSIGLENVRV